MQKLMKKNSKKRKGKNERINTKTKTLLNKKKDK